MLLNHQSLAEARIILSEATRGVEISGLLGAARRRLRASSARRRHQGSNGLGD